MPRFELTDWRSYLCERRRRLHSEHRQHRLGSVSVSVYGVHSANDLCRREGIKPHSYYSWTKEFMEAGRERLARDAVRDATQHEVKQLRRENEELKQLVGDLSLEAYRLKKTAIPMPHDASGISG